MEKSESQRDELYIPLGIKSEQDIFPGFGKKETIQIGIVLVFTLMGVITYYTASNDSFGAILSLMFIGATAIVIIRKNENNQSVVDLARHVFTYYRSQRKYQYQYLDEWEM
ncbi:hypothetical protein LNN31_08310 [Acetobacterium wieringae]|uniref:PrgI family protein n=1 Tax=Acetobacterium wieringae TaxID=52694 RepID=A0ABY6HLD9_9FIRM|nr:hypothetical protein [Acetobacterium wieringae]UYO64411.1 hypothetical protein LNN31_08310 [Acetobacterium wieringae]VUZ25213.1 Uncharacterised protein [Acetobacterium wieringae]